MESEETEMETKISDRNGVSEETTSDLNEEKDATKRKSDTINDSVGPPEKRLKSEDDSNEDEPENNEDKENNEIPENTENDVKEEESEKSADNKEKEESEQSPEEGDKTDVIEEEDKELRTETEQSNEDNCEEKEKTEEQEAIKETQNVEKEEEEKETTNEKIEVKKEQEETKTENTDVQEEKPNVEDINESLNKTSEDKVEEDSSEDKTNQNDVVDFTLKKDTNSDEKKVKHEKGSPTVVKMNGIDKDDASSGKSEDSEKENRQMDIDIPMDLSRKPATTNGGNDIIMLSDSEEEFMMNGDIVEPSWEEIRKRQKVIKRYQSDLRNEEAKLVLLKKLKQSQVSHQLQEHPSNANSKSQPSAHKHSSQPPPLVRGSQQQQQQQQQQTQARPAHSQPPQLMRGNQVPQSSRSHQQGPPPLVNMGGQRMSENQRRMSAHMGYPGNMVQNSSPSNMMSNYRQSQSAQAQSAQQVDNQTPAQRQAAAKMALRKQLEKTLLQIPPPKPPPPEMNFVPSLASPDFISLLGLEEAVNYIIDAALISKGQKNPDEKMICNPFTCVQCNTDFTPVWKREKAGSKNVICEHCVTTNQKKALKQEHTNRLKSAFVKALQQEQEIERMQSQTSSSSSSTPSSNNQPPAPSPNIPVSVPSSSSLSSFKVTSEALRQHQNFIQAHQAVAAHQTALRMGQPLGLAPFGARGAFPYQIPFGAKPSDLQLQRQYLLDMIPNRGQMAWKP